MIVTCDFETFYSQRYSLRRMSEVEYILSPEYQTIMCGIKVGDRPTYVATGDAQVRQRLAEIDWSNAALLSHNTRFDGSILAWRYGIRPRLLLCTMSMARALIHAYTGSSSLEKVANYLDLPAKGTAVHSAIGLRLEDFTPAQLAEYQEYCTHDTDLCHDIFHCFMQTYQFPKSELKLIDLSLRMFILPQAKLNPDKLASHLDAVRVEKLQAFAQLEYVDRAVFSSNERFAQLLESHGVDVPMKLSPQTGQQTYALAKNDRAFKELCADPDLPMLVQAMLQIRLGEKSTQEETRTATLLNLARQDWRDAMGVSERAMPVPYRYYGAHTGRFSGDGGYNFANLKRGSPIRDAIEAPPGYKIVHRDSSQIEARLLAWLAGCTSLVEAFRAGRDVYCEFASHFYRRAVTKAEPIARHIGKTAVLSLGYGAGHERFRHALFIGTGGMSVEIDLAEAARLVFFYRDTSYPEIPRLWKQAQRLIDFNLPEGSAIKPEQLPVVAWQGDGFKLPNGLRIPYPNLRLEPDPTRNAPQTYYDGPYGRKKIYGPKVIENVNQALARIVVTDAMLRVAVVTGYHPIMSTYDSADYCVPAAQAAEFDAYLESEFAVPPAWAPDLPLASEGGWGSTLLEAERRVNQ